MFNAFHKDRIGLSFRELFALTAMSLILLLVGSRFVYAIAAMNTHGFSFEIFVRYLIHGGIVFYGGMLGMLLGCVIFAKLTHRGIREVLDYAAPSIPLFHTFGRLGCLFGGCCYGRVWSWGVTNVDFPGVRLFPVQAIESVCNLIIFMSIILVQHIKKSDRYSIEIYLMSYASVRFILEFFRGDEGRGMWPDGLSTSQNIALIIIIAVSAELIYVYLKHKRG